MPETNKYEPGTLFVRTTNSLGFGINAIIMVLEHHGSDASMKAHMIETMVLYNPLDRYYHFKPGDLYLASVRQLDKHWRQVVL